MDEPEKKPEIPSASSNIQKSSNEEEVKDSISNSETKVSTSKQPMKVKEDSPVMKSLKFSSTEAGTTSELNQSSNTTNENKTILNGSAKPGDNIKTKIIQDYSNIIETIQQQNATLEKLKDEILSITISSIRKGLVRRYIKAEDYLNYQLLKAINARSEVPPVGPNICFYPHSVNKSRLHVSYEDENRIIAGENLELKNNSEHTNATSPSNELKYSDDPDTFFKNLLDKIDKINTENDIHPENKSSAPLNHVIVHLLKSRKKHMNECINCNTSPENCRMLESFDEELSRVCRIKLSQLKRYHHRQSAGCERDDPKLIQTPSSENVQYIHQYTSSSSADDQSIIWLSEQDVYSYSGLERKKPIQKSCLSSLSLKGKQLSLETQRPMFSISLIMRLKDIEKDIGFVQFRPTYRT